MAARRRRISARAVAAGPLDAFERIPVLGEHLRELVSDGADLEHHHADGVGDDVVELPGDPCALLGDGDACGGLALALGPGGAFFRRFGLLGTLAQGVARDPSDHEPEGNEDEDAGRLIARDVVDDDHDADEHDDQANTRLHGAPQVPEQERACQPDDAEAADERKQQSVDERERRGQEPVGRRSGEGKAPTCEQRQHENRHRRYGEPQRRGRRARRVASDDELEHARDRQERDQQLEPVLTREVSDPAHELKVLQALPLRLLPE